MALRSDGGGGRSYGLGGGLLASVGSYFSRRRRQEEEEEARIRAFQEATAQAKATFTNQGAPLSVMRRPDPATEVIESIRRVGGPQAFSSRVSEFADWWQQKTGRPAPAALTLDIARTPVDLNQVKDAISKADRFHVRGLDSPTSERRSVVFNRMATPDLGTDNQTVKGSLLRRYFREREQDKLRLASKATALIGAGVPAEQAVDDLAAETIQEAKSGRYVPDDYPERFIEELKAHDRQKAMDGRTAWSQLTEANIERPRIPSEVGLGLIAEASVIDEALDVVPMAKATTNQSRDLIAEINAQMESWSKAEAQERKTPMYWSGDIIARAVLGLLDKINTVENYGGVGAERNSVTQEVLALIPSKKYTPDNYERMQTLGFVMDNRLVDLYFERYDEYRSLVESLGPEAADAEFKRRHPEEYNLNTLYEVTPTLYKNRVDTEQMREFYTALGFEVDEQGNISGEQKRFSLAVSYEKTKQAIEQGETMGTALLRLGDIDPEKHPVLAAAVDFIGKAMLEIVVTGPIGAIRTAAGESIIMALTGRTLNKMRLLDDMASWLAKEKSVLNIRRVTGINDMEVLTRLSEATTRDQVAKILEESVLSMKPGRFITPGSVLLKERMGLRVRQAVNASLVPKTIRRAFAHLPDPTLVNVMNDAELHKGLRAIQQIADLPDSVYDDWVKEIGKVAKVVKDDRHLAYAHRVRVMNKAWDQMKSALGDKFAEAEEYQLKHSVRSKLAAPKQMVMEPDADIGVPPGLRSGMEQSRANLERELSRLRARAQAVEAEADSLRAHLRVNQSAGEGDDIAEYASRASERLAALEKEQSALQQTLKTFEMSEDELDALAKDMFEREVADAAEEMINYLASTGGLRKGAFGELEKGLTYKETLELYRGRWEQGGMLAPQGKGRSLKEALEALKRHRAELLERVGIESEDDLADFLGRGIYKRQVKAADMVDKLKPFVDNLKSSRLYQATAHRMIQVAEQIESHKALVNALDEAAKVEDDVLRQRAMVTAKEVEDGIRLQEGAIKQRLKDVEDDLEAYRAAESSLLSQQDMAVPLHPYQAGVYWYWPVAPEFLFARTSGIPIKVLDHLNRGFVVRRSLASKLLPPAFAGAAGAGLGWATAESTEDGLPTWAAILAGAAALAGPTAAVQKGRGLWKAKRLSKMVDKVAAGELPASELAQIVDDLTEEQMEKLGPELLGEVAGQAAKAGGAVVKVSADDFIKLTPNFDYLIGHLWKRYALGSLGIRIRIALDEPLRMLSQGFGSDSLLAWTKRTSARKWAMTKPLLRLDEGEAETSLMYLLEGRYPSTWQVFHPGNDGYEEALRISYGVRSKQGPVKAWVKEGPDGLRRYLLNRPQETLHMLGIRHSDDLAEYIEDYDRVLTKATHRRVTDSSYGHDAFGRLKPEQVDEWRVYEQSKAPTLNAPQYISAPDTVAPPGTPVHKIGTYHHDPGRETWVAEPPTPGLDEEYLRVDFLDQNITMAFPPPREEAVAQAMDHLQRWDVPTIELLEEPSDKRGFARTLRPQLAKTGKEPVLYTVAELIEAAKRLNIPGLMVRVGRGSTAQGPRFPWYVKGKLPKKPAGVVKPSDFSDELGQHLADPEDLASNTAKKFAAERGSIEPFIRHGKVDDYIGPNPVPELEKRWSEAFRKYGADSPRAKAAYERYRQADNAYHGRIAHAVACGAITPEEAVQKYGNSVLTRIYGLDKAAPLPERLWHVTTSRSGLVYTGRLMTRNELDMGLGRGLGGGPRDAISFTANENTAQAIKRSLTEASQFARGEIDIEDLLAAARNGLGNDGKPYLDEILAAYHVDSEEALIRKVMGEEPEFVVEYLPSPRTPDEFAVKQAAKTPKGATWEPVGAPTADGRYFAFRRRLTTSEYRAKRFQFYKTFSTLREYATGGRIEDPFFFLNDVEALAKTPPHEIAIVELVPNKVGPHPPVGYQVSGLDEWRTWSGEAVRIEAIDGKPYTPGSEPHPPSAYYAGFQGKTVVRPSSYEIASQRGGAPIRGQAVISPEDPRIPDVVYHVTPRAADIRREGRIRALGEGGLGGDPRDRVVSLTVNRQVAEQLAEDMRFHARLHSTDLDSALDMMAKQADAEGWGDVWRGQPVFDATGQVAEPLRSNSTLYFERLFFTVRKSETGKPNPIFYEVAKFSPQDVDIIEVPRSSLRNGALLVDFDLGQGGLEEIRSYGDVLLAPKREPVPTPSWFNPETDRVIRELDGTYVHYRRVATWYDWLAGNKKISKRELEAIPEDLKPTVAARRERTGPRAHLDKAVSLVDKVFDTLYGISDAMMKNARTNIYIIEYRRALAFYEKFARKMGLEVDEEALHQAASAAAREATDFKTYTGSRTVLEHAMRIIYPFAPAQRDFLTFWLAEMARRPSRMIWFARYQQLPDELKLDWSDITGNGSNVWLAALTGATGLSLNPLAMTFLGGGSGMRSSDTPLEINALEWLLPGLSPIITTPASWLASTHPEKFGDLDMFPGLGFIGSEGAPFGRLERITWVMSGLVNRIAKGDWEGIDIPFWSRNPEARRRLTDLTLQYLALQEGKDIVNMTKEEAEELAKRAKAVVYQQEFWTGFLGFISPAIPFFRNFEQRELRAALTTYKNTYDLNVISGADGDVLSPGTMPAALTRALKLRQQLREEYPDYAPGFDWIDAIFADDEEAIQDLADNYPQWLSYFTSIYNHVADVTPDEMDPRSLEAFIYNAERGLRPPKIPEELASEIRDKARRAKMWSDATAAMQQFEEEMAARGYKPGDAEYAEARAKKLEELRAQSRVYLGVGTEPLSRFWSTQRWISTYEKMRQEGTSPELEAWQRDRANALRQEMEDRLKTVPKGSVYAKFIKRHYEEIFMDEGLPPNLLYKSELRTAAERQSDELWDFISSDPWEWHAEDYEKRGLPYDDSVTVSLGRILDMRQAVEREIANRQVVTAPMYQRLRASGNLDSPTWQRFFQALDEAAAWAKANTESGRIQLFYQRVDENGQVQIGYSTRTKEGRAREAMRRKLVGLLADLRAQDQEFSRKFDELLEAGVSFDIYQEKPHIRSSSIFDKDNADLLFTYQENVRAIAATDPVFKAAWEYYQKPLWERLRDSGRFTSKYWRDVFDGMAQVSAWVNGYSYDVSGELVPNSPSRSFELYANGGRGYTNPEMEKWRRAMVKCIEDTLRESDAEGGTFRQEWEELFKRHPNIFDFYRRW